MLLTVSSTLPIQQAIAYSISCSKAEKEIDLLRDGGKIIKGKNIDHHGPRTISNICHLPDPPTFSLDTLKILVRAIINAPTVQKWALVTNSSSYFNVQSRLV